MTKLCKHCFSVYCVLFLSSEHLAIKQILILLLMLLIITQEENFTSFNVNSFLSFIFVTLNVIHSWVVTLR